MQGEIQSSLALCRTEASERDARRRRGAGEHEARARAEKSKNCLARARPAAAEHARRVFAFLPAT